MRSLQHSYAVEHGSVIPESDLSPAARAILERMARCSYMISMHREGIAINSRRLAELRRELDTVEARS